MYLLLNMGIFQCHVSFQACIHSFVFFWGGVIFTSPPKGRQWCRWDGQSSTAVEGSVFFFSGKFWGVFLGQFWVEGKPMQVLWYMYIYVIYICTYIYIYMYSTFILPLPPNPHHPEDHSSLYTLCVVWNEGCTYLMSLPATQGRAEDDLSPNRGRAVGLCYQIIRTEEGPPGWFRIVLAWKSCSHIALFGGVHVTRYCRVPMELDICCLKVFFRSPFIARFCS